MSMTWTGTGGLFTVVGKIAGSIRNTIGRRNVTDPDTTAHWGASGPIIKCLGTEIGDIITAHSTAQSPWYDGIRDTQASMITAQNTYITTLVAYATTFITNAVNANVIQPDNNITTIMTELIRQMGIDTKTVNRCTAAITATAGSANIGLASAAVSVTGRFGVPLEYACAETLMAKVTSDRHTGATRGQEPLSVAGSAVKSDKFDNDWPDGSGASITINVVDPNIEGTTTGNLLSNSNFDTWTVTNVPDDWAILVGVAGTDVKRNVANIYASFNAVACLELDCDGATLVSVAQTFADETLDPATVYAWSFWISADAAPAAGVLKVDLVDSTNTVVNDDAGTANSTTVNLNTLTTTYVKLNGFIRTPTNMPSQCKLRISTPTAGTTGRKIYIDFGALAPATQLYVGGPYFVLFRGKTDLIVNDNWSLAVTNDRAGIIQTFFEQAFGMSSMGLILPSSGSPNIADSLVS